MTSQNTLSVAYTVLADLFEFGVREEDKERLYALFGVTPTTDYEGAAHYRALGLAVPPHESVFADPDGVVGGVCSQRVVDTYARIGFAYDVTGAAPDHLSVQLRALASICEGPDSAQRVMVDGLLSWVPMLAYALRDYAPYGAAADMLVAVLLEHRSPLPADRFVIPPLAPAPVDLDDPSTRLRDIAVALCRPCVCGMWISRFDVTRLARAVEASHGFGERALMLENLLSSASDRSALPRLLDALREDVSGWRRHLTTVPDVYATAWRERLAWTEATLTTIDERASML